MKLFRYVILFIGIISGLHTVRAQSRPVTGVYAIEIGSKDVLATYLSPLHYKGTDLGLSGIWRKAMPFNPDNAVMTFEGGADFSNLWNPAGTARMIGLNARFSWGMAWRRHLPYNLQFTLGGNAGIDGGAYYLMKNSNNPVQVQAQAALGITGSLSYNFKLGNLNLLLADRLEVPSIGLFFSPEYEESFYEIYLGNRKGLVHAGWWGNNFRLDNLLSLTFDFGRTSAMIGYRFNANTQWANNLNTHIFTHSLVIGIIPGGIGLKKRLPDAIYADF